MTTLLPRRPAVRTARTPIALTRRVAELAANPLVEALAYPHGVDRYVDAFRPGAVAGGMTARVVATTGRTARATSLLLQPERPMTFAAGQHLLVTVELDGVRRTRCYSLSDTPHRHDGLLEITVAHLPEGRVSSHLHLAAAEGDLVGISAPQGVDFLLPATRPDHLVLVGGGSGVTPLRSMWRTMAAEGVADRVTVLLYARTEADAIFADEVRALASGHVILTREPGTDRAADRRLSGRFTPDHLAALGIDPATADLRACGPHGLVTAVAEHWATAAPHRPVATESFAPPVAPSDPSAEGGVLTFARSGRSAHGDGRTLLEQAEAAGLTPAAGCRMGICRTCTTTKHAGVVRDIRSGTTDDGGECEVQLCISQPVGDVQLDL
jgi:stearoyl-CoA 9-desaturase NADPH oxidoreductase